MPSILGTDNTSFSLSTFEGASLEHARFGRRSRCAGCGRNLTAEWSLPRDNIGEDNELREESRYAYLESPCDKIFDASNSLDVLSRPHGQC